MESHIPQISIGLPVYNSQEYIENVIHSLLMQSFSDFELIISDDNSIDNTIRICESFSRIDQRIIIYKQDVNIGMVRNQNFVLSKARGQFFMWAAHDDYYSAEFIKELIEILETNSRMVSAFCNVALFSRSYLEHDKIINLNFSSTTTIRRLIKFTYKFNDAHFYGIHCTEVLLKTKVPIWWGKNQITPANSNYPVLYYLLAAGEYGYVNGDPLFYKRQKKETYSLGPSKTIYHQVLFLIFRKVNLLILSCFSIQSAKKNLVITLATAPFLFARISHDTIKETIFLFKLYIKRT